MCPFPPTAIYEPSLCLQTTARVLAKEGIDPDQEMLEVVETVKVEDFGRLNSILDYCRKQGISTVFDDIGSGYSDVASLIRCCFRTGPSCRAMAPVCAFAETCGAQR